MSALYFVFSLIVIGIVGAITWKHEKSQGEDYEPDALAIAKNIGIAVVILFLFWQLLKFVCSQTVEYWWFQNVGYPDVWITKKTYEWALFILGFGITWISLTATQLLAHYSVPGVPKKTEVVKIKDLRNSMVFCH